MNGEVNGTMQEPMETSPVSPDNNTLNKKVTSEDCDNVTKQCEDSNNTGDSNDLDGEPILDPVLKSNQSLSGNYDHGVSQEDKLSKEITEKSTGEENSNNLQVESNCSNSNESFPESTTSSQGKSESMEQQTIDDKSKDGHSEKDYSKNFNTNDMNSDDEVDSEEDSSDEEGSETEPIAEDTVSINSDSDPDPEGRDDVSQDGHTKHEISDIIVLENETPNSQNGNSLDEVHEIESDNDDCVVSTVVKPIPVVDVKKTLRRSSRAIKRKRYSNIMQNGDYESDIEEVEMEDPLKRKTRPMTTNDTKPLVDMAAKQMKANQNNQKKEPTVVIIDTNSIIAGKDSALLCGKNSSTNSSASAQALYQSIVARGTTVTPVTSKGTSTQNTSQPQQPSILPSLTDDMFVVEAPSFIVPYVYEKPSMKPFREFVDILGKELEEQRAKEEKEQLVKEKEEKEKRDKERQERKDRGENIEETDEEPEKTETTETETTNVEDAEELEEKKRKKAEKRERRKRGNQDDDDSWDGETSTESEDEINSDEEDKTVVIKDKADSIEEIKDVTDLTGEKVCLSKPDNYFDCSLGKFFINIGINLVQEYVQNDLLKQQNRKLYREKKAGHSTKTTETSIVSLMKNLEFSKENNAPFAFTEMKCKFCSFKSESILVMSHHLETPHMKNNVYKCNFCDFEIRSPHDILYHMEAEHNSRGRLERAPAYHQCANCPFEDNGKGKLARHLIPCAKKFKPEHNLAPPIEWEPPAKIPKIAKSRSNMMGSYQNAFNRSTFGNNLGRPSMSVANMLPGVSSAFRARGRSPMAVPPRAAPVHGTPIIRGGVMVRHNSPILVSSNYPIANNGKSKSMHQPSISITPLPRHPQPPVQSQTTSQAKNTFVICEICDGYIKDLEQLRNHMQWIHKVKIHPKMIYNRPPLNCQKCQFRFFTDQGLERHLLGSHGLVTSSMQEAANKGKDAGRCPVCGRVYQWKLLNHVARDHNLTLKPAHLSYKCTVCTATFGMYKQFENHVYSAHSVVAKRVMDKSKPSSTAAKTANDSLLKPLKINDEITIIPQPVKSSTSTKDK